MVRGLQVTNAEKCREWSQRWWKKARHDIVFFFHRLRNNRKYLGSFVYRYNMYIHTYLWHGGSGRFWQFFTVIFVIPLWELGLRSESDHFRSGGGGTWGRRCAYRFCTVVVHDGWTFFEVNFWKFLMSSFCQVLFRREFNLAQFSQWQFPVQVECLKAQLRYSHGCIRQGTGAPFKLVWDWSYFQVLAFCDRKI